MGEKPAGGEEPTLELPKLFGRRKKKQPRSDDTSAVPEETAPPAPPPEPQPSAPAPTAAPLPPPVPEPQPAPTPVDDAPPVREAPPAREAPEEPVPAPITDAPAPEHGPIPDVPAPEHEPISAAAGSTPTRAGRRERRTRTRPRIPGTLAALLTGLVVGAAGCGLTYAALRGCEAVRGTSTCGGPGLFLLIAILALMVLLGAGLLTLMRIASAGSTSFLAVGLVAVLVMVALLDVVFSPWMFLVVPLMASAAYLLSHWVTTRFADEAADPAVFEDAPGPDVR